MLVVPTKQPSVFKCDIRYSKEFRNILNMWECMHWYNILKKNTIIQTQKNVFQGPRAFPLLLYRAQNGMFIFFYSIHISNSCIHTFNYISVESKSKSRSATFFQIFTIVKQAK